MNPPEDRSPSWTRYVVLAALCFATTVAYIDRGFISVAIEPIRGELQLTDDEIGSVMSAFFLTYTLFQLPAGWLGQVWGPRRALTLFAVGWSAATGVAALALGLPLLVISRLALGAAEAGVFPAAASTIAVWFPATKRALCSGIFASCMGVGAFLGALLTGGLLTEVSWRGVFLLYAAPGVVWAVWFWFWFRDRPEDHPGVNAAELELIRDIPFPEPEKVEERREPTPWGAILTSRAMWALNGQQFFKAAAYVFYLSWFPSYLQRTHGVSLPEAAALSSLPHIMFTIGPIIGGWYSDWLLVRTRSRRWSRQGLSVVTLLLCGVLVLLAAPIANAWLAVVVISCGAFASGLSGPCAYAATIDMGGKHVAPVFSLMNMSGNLGAVIFPWLVPKVLEWSGSWDVVLMLFAGLYLAAGLCWLPFDPEGSIVARED